ncbi:uncharacterized protein LOC109861101 [Pseudomyrmex gracilis]|uniref:uncharacterized protein LOC109861101 n=1 Tax=Pseudomyrmex gracilis TaxID=219809 RepID=UPI0009956138|nr:uncharacterized protein LOC109861101 [Pseudomyrmex gracilis]
MSSPPVLCLYSPTAETQLHTDASSHGLGGILLQKQLSVFTDCNAIVHAVNKANLNPRIARWTLALQNYKFKIKHRIGQKMAHVDALSRQVTYINSLPLERELELKQLLDPRLSKIATNLEFADDDRFELIDGLVYRKTTDGSRFAVPDAMVSNVIRIYHDNMAHCEKTTTDDGYRFVFIAVDAYTRFTWLMPTKTTNAKEVLAHLNHLFRTFGNPDELVTDRGTAFTSRDSEDFLDSRKVKYRLVAVASPWANGLVERVNKFLKSSLKKLISDASEWKSYIDEAQYVLSNTHHMSIKSTPAKLLLGYDCKNHADKDLAELTRQLTQQDTDLPTEKDVNRDIAVEASEKLRLYNKQYYDSKHTKPSQYQSGDYVMVRDLHNKPGENSKFKSAYKGPYMISKVLNKNRFVVTDIPGFNVAQKPYNAILSPDKLKPWIKPVLTS